MSTAKGKLAYSAREAAEATGIGIDTIKRAVRSGDLPAKFPRIDGREVAKYVILADDLEAWITDSTK